MGETFWTKNLEQQILDEKFWTKNRGPKNVLGLRPPGEEAAWPPGEEAMRHPGEDEDVGL